MSGHVARDGTLRAAVVVLILFTLGVRAGAADEPSVTRRTAYGSTGGIIAAVASPMGAQFAVRPVAGGRGESGLSLIAPDFRRLEPGSYRVTVTLNGYEPQETTVRIAPGEAAVVEAVLQPQFRVVRTEAAETARALPYGTYEVDEGDGTPGVGIRPRFRQQELLEFFDLAVPISLGATLLFSLVEFALPAERTPRVPILTIGGQGATLGFVAGGMIMRSRRDDFYAGYDPPEVVLLREPARVAYEAAREAAAAGRLLEADRHFSELLRLHPSSSDVPRALVQRARIALAEGDTAAAEEHLREVRERYRDLRVYDEAGVLRAEVLRQRGAHAQAIEVLTGVPVLADGTYAPAEVAFQRLLSYEARAAADGVETGRAAAVRTGIAEAEKWLSDFGGSDVGGGRGTEVRCMLIDLYETAGRDADASALWEAFPELPPACAPQRDEVSADEP